MTKTSSWHRLTRRGTDRSGSRRGDDRGSTRMRSLPFRVMSVGAPLPPAPSSLKGCAPALPMLSGSSSQRRSCRRRDRGRFAGWSSTQRGWSALSLVTSRRWPARARRSVRFHGIACKPFASTVWTRLATCGSVATPPTRPHRSLTWYSEARGRFGFPCQGFSRPGWHRVPLLPARGSEMRDELRPDA